MVLHQDHSRGAACLMLPARKLPANGKRQIRAGIRIRHPAPAVPVYVESAGEALKEHLCICSLPAGRVLAEDHRLRGALLGSVEPHIALGMYGFVRLPQYLECGLVGMEDFHRHILREASFHEFTDAATAMEIVSEFHDVN